MATPILLGGLHFTRRVQIRDDTPMSLVISCAFSPKSEWVVAESIHLVKTEWTLTREAFDRLLDWLSPDREEAGKKYEAIRRRLIKLFNCRGCHNPEELTDDAMTRVIKILDSKGLQYSGDPILIFFGVAKNVFREWVRKKPLNLEEFASLAPVSREQELQCLEACIKQLPERGRRVIIRYYEQRGSRKTDHRRTIAAELGLEVSALRVLACRMRKLLRNCVSTCLERKAA